MSESALAIRWARTRLVVLVFALAGCGGETSSAEQETEPTAERRDPPPGTRDGAKGPSHAWTLAKEACAKEQPDWRAFAKLLSPDTRRELIAMTVLMASPKSDSARKELDRICAEHGIERNVKFDFDDQSKTIEQSTAKVTRPSDALAALFAWQQPDRPDGELVDLEVEGSQATAKGMFFDRSGAKRTRTVHFSRIKKRWFLDMTNARKRTE